ncbi:L,D-transpeptidase family protein [Govanella unica]|uniref:L,D-transpeptidase family protein n=1 Tax=Govanella unica TaxID=2975056 RepID=A0A9X3U123_9PROT|nr:L,D-transpeptidase family protein [Govania unica]MDA5195128.1 L,D-transpeptidase family protein [Govania unica]
MSAAAQAIPAFGSDQEAVREAIEAGEAGRIPERSGVNMTLDQATQRFYAARQFAPVWTEPRMVDELLAGLAGMADDGLDPEDYALGRLKAERAALGAKGSDGSREAAFDVLATRAFIHALFHLNRGKLDPSDIAPRPIDATAELQRILDGLGRGEVQELFALARPQSPLYSKLREGLKNLRSVAAAGGWPVIASGPALKAGMIDPRVGDLRKRLVVGGYLPAAAVASDSYDPALVAAVQKFQTENQLDADGTVGEATLAALNVPVAARIDQIRVNLERARELLDTAVGDFVLVDIAGYKVSYYRDGKAIWSSRVQVGKPYRQTPVFKSQITYITLNPTWTVPPTILKNDVLPKIRHNKGYLAAQHMRVLNAQGQEISPRSVDWNNPRGITLRQDAGPWGALGQVAIRFPNPYAVYLHDTPHQELFGKAQRDFSSGCIRTEQPFELVYLLFNASDVASKAVIDDAVKTGKTQTRTLPKPVPLMLIYWTVNIEDDGRITFKPDIYDRDPAVLAALNKREEL